MSERYFFLSCRILPTRQNLSESEFAILAQVIGERRKLHGFLLNPVKAGLVQRPDDWIWSSVHDYTGNANDRPVTPSGLSVEHVFLPADPRTRI